MTDPQERPRLGVVFPQTEIEADPTAIRRYAEGVAELGFDHFLIYDHVTSVDPGVHQDFVEIAHADGATSPRPYSIDDPFHELFVLMGYLAGVCDLELVSGVLVLPQRQTALVAKQAAQVDLLTGGRLRVGVGIGWNRLEYRSLGMDFGTRAARLEAQIGVLRDYWTARTASTATAQDWAEGVGIVPRPVQTPIPIWIAGGAPPALRRVGRLGDGWLPVTVDPRQLHDAWADVRRAAEAAGRDPGALGLQGRLPVAGAPGQVPEQLTAWSELGATHVAIDTMRAGLHGVDAHLGALAAVVDQLPGGVRGGDHA